MTKNGRTIREKVLALLRAPDYRPRDRNEIARELGLKGRERVSVRKTLRELENGARSSAFEKIVTFFLPRPTSSPESCRSIRRATVFLSRKKRESRTFSLRQKIPGPR